MAVQIEFKRSGFPVKIGELELWFDSSVENLRKFFNVNEIAQKKLREVQKKSEHIHFPKGIENYSLEDFAKMDVQKIDAAFDSHKEFIAIQYDIVFGKGTFAKIYEKYTDINALEEMMDPLFFSIAEQIEEYEKERKDRVSDLRKKALRMQRQKRKK